MLKKFRILYLNREKVDQKNKSRKKKIRVCWDEWRNSQQTQEAVKKVIDEVYGEIGREAETEEILNYLESKYKVSLFMIQVLVVA